MSENECKNSYIVIQRMSVIICMYFVSFFVLFFLSYANGVDPDQTPRFVAFDLVLHGLLMS